MAQVAVEHGCLQCGGEHSPNLSKLVEQLRTGCPDEQVLAVNSLVALAADEGNQDLLVDAGAVPAFVESLKESGPVVQEQAIRGLWRLSLHHADNKSLIAKAGTIELLVTILQYEEDRIPARELACGLVGSLAMNNAANKSAAAQAGAIRPIVQLLDGCGASAAEHASRTLWYLVANCRENKAAVAKAGAIPLLVNLMQSKWIDVKTHASGVLASLGTNNAANRAAILRTALAKGSALDDLGLQWAQQCKKVEPCEEPVFLHIYDLGAGSKIRHMNEVLRSVGTGAFHAGVEVYGEEWSFGHHSFQVSGVYKYPPRKCAGHSFRETVPMGYTTLSRSEVDLIIVRFAKEWPGKDYHMLRRNCCHFSAVFCQALRVGPVPDWVTNLAGTANLLIKTYREASQSAEEVALSMAAKAGEIDEQYKIWDTAESTARGVLAKAAQHAGHFVEHVAVATERMLVATAEGAARSWMASLAEGPLVPEPMVEVSEIVLQCTHVSGLDIDSWPWAQRCMVLNIDDGPWMISLQRLPDLLSFLVRNVESQRCCLSGAQFMLYWVAPWLYVSKEASEVLLVNGVSVQTPTLKLPIDAEIGLCNKSESEPFLVFRVLRHFATGPIAAAG